MRIMLLVAVVMVLSALCSVHGDAESSIGAGAMYTLHTQSGSDNETVIVYVNLADKERYRVQATIDGTAYTSQDLPAGSYVISQPVSHKADHTAIIALLRNRMVFEGWKLVDSLTRNSTCDE